MFNKGKMVYRLFSSKGAIAGLAIIIFLVLIAILAPLIAPKGPFAIVATPYLSPSLKFPFGTDGLGRNIFAQMIWGTRLSLEIAFYSALGITAIGTVVGLTSGYLGSIYDEVLMRFVDVILVIPSIAFMIFVSVLLGPSVFTILIVIIVFGWPPMARMVRSQVLSLKQRNFIESAKLGGAPPTYIISRLLLPNVTSLIIANGILAVVYSIVAEVSLAFLGLSPSNVYSWGTVLYNALNESAIYNHGYLWIIMPGVFIALTGIGITLLARSFSDIIDPRYVGSRRW